MLNDSKSILRQAPWTMLFPGAALTLTVFALNLLGDGLRDLLDPRLRRL
jgi:peptide/nickel transport system permease protein